MEWTTKIQTQLNRVADRYVHGYRRIDECVEDI